MAEVYNSADWRTKCKNVNETFAEARKKAMFVDVRFLVGPSASARHFSAHKTMLACGSPVFEAMLFGQLAEKEDPINLPEDDPEAFEIMLQYLYGECIVFPSIVVACKSHSIGDKYLIPELTAKSAEFIKASTMNEENFWGIIKGDLVNSEFIVQKFHRFIELNADKLVKSDEFLHAPEYILKTFLQMEVLNISEYELLSSVSKWCLQNFTKDTTEKTRDLLQYIRISLLTSAEFCQYIENFPDILDPATSLQILKHLSHPSSYDLPVRCSTNKAARKGPDQLTEDLFSEILRSRIHYYTYNQTKYKKRYK